MEKIPVIKPQEDGDSTPANNSDESSKQGEKNREQEETKKDKAMNPNSAEEMDKKEGKKPKEKNTYPK